jgi:putative transposase
VKFVFIAAEKAVYPVGVLCDVLGVSRSGYYAWSGRPEPARAKSDAQLKAQIAAVHEKSRSTYGSPRVHAELRGKGVRVGKKRVERLMRDDGIKARQKRRFRLTTDSNHTHPIAPNVLARQFTVTAPNKVWVTDVTYIATDEGWLYLAAILDLFSRRVVAWATSATNDRALALDALELALRARQPAAGLLHHSDRGSPYASEDYRQALRQRGLAASMSRSGDCWDNAVAESFFATLKTELIRDIDFLTRDQARREVFAYIEGSYNRRRRHSSLGYANPNKFELAFEQQAEAA